MKQIDVSIIIASWNTREILYNCLQSVYEQTRNILFQVIVIDNASSDGSSAMVKEKFPQAVLIENTENRGFAAANNQGIAVAEGRYVLLLNSDTLIRPDAINGMVAFADSRPQSAVFGCQVLNPDETLQPTCFMFPSVLNMLLSTTYLYKLFPRNRFFGREKMTWWDRKDIRQVDVVTGCFMLVRHEAIDRIGVMDEEFFMYGEETDWCYRFKQAGWTIMFNPAMKIIHLGGQSSKQIQAKMLVQLKLSILRFIKKHNGWLSYKTASVLAVLFFAIRVPIWFVIWGLDNNHRKTAAIKLQAYVRGIKQILFPSFGSPARREAI